jgi:hypothetical protein
MWNFIKSLRTENTLDNVNTTDEMLISRRGSTNFFRLTLSQLKEYFTKNIPSSNISEINSTYINVDSINVNSGIIVDGSITTNMLTIGEEFVTVERITDVTGIDVSATLTDSFIININGVEYYVPVKPVS